MRPLILIPCSMALAALCGCGPQGAASSLEKGGPVMARGYVDLMPPSNYSPERGVICESLSVDSEDRKTGACYTPEGPSVMLTARHISETAASDLREKLTARGHTGAFTMATGVSCDPGLRKCRFTPESVGAGQPAPLHTSALFWTDVPQ